MRLNEKLEKLAGKNDSGVVVSVWSWPDGSWGAGIVLIDRAKARQQGLPAAMLPEQNAPLWNHNFGFLGGVNEMGHSPEDAVEALEETLCRLRREKQAGRRPMACLVEA